MITKYLTSIIPQGAWLDTWPSTNAKIVFGMRLTFAYIVVLLGAAIADSITAVSFALTDQAIQVFEIIGWLLAALLGLAVAQFGAKRATANPAMVAATAASKGTTVAAGPSETTLVAVMAVKEQEDTKKTAAPTDHMHEEGE